MISPLVIGHSYLLERYSTGQVLRSFFERLTDYGFAPTIVCSKSYHNDVNANNLKCNIVPTYDCQPIRYAIALAKRAIATDFAFLPDYTFFSWAKTSAINKCVKLAVTGKYDYIHSVSIPCSSHLIAAEVKKQVGIPWIASFYDPWYENPYRQIHFQWAKERDKRYEEYIAKNADIIIHTNHVICEEWIKRYGDIVENKLYVLPLVFNELSTTKDVPLTKKNKFVISHIGSLYAGRNASDFICSVNTLLQKHPEIKSDIEINFVGTVPNSDKSLVEQYGLSDIIKYVGFIPENQCISYFTSSDLFVAIDGKEARDIFFPSKIMKYLYYGKPILGLSPHNSVLDQELSLSGNYCFFNEDINGISDFLYKAIISYSSICTNNKQYWEKFSIKNVAIQYQKIVKQLLSNKAFK